MGRHLYWKAPYPLKCLMASWFARRLDRQRYGPDYERCLQAIAERDAWPAERFLDYQDGALREIVRLAGDRVPHYRDVLAEAGIDPARFGGLKDLARLPVLEKQTVRSDPVSLVDATLDRRKLLLLHTSGTTGTPLDLYRDRSLNSAAFAYLDSRWHAGAGVRRRDHRSVSIGGHLVAAAERNRPPFWVENRRWQQLYMSSYHLSEQHLPAYVRAIREFRCDYIEGYPSSVFAIARHVVDKGLEPITAKACFTTAETLLDNQRDTIQRAFQCRVYDQYGCGEMAVFAAECAEGSMHLSPEFGIVEVLDDQDQPLPLGEVGQLVCTSLINRVQPFIRYRLGDSGALRPGQCSCGSPLPMLARVEGRTDDVLVTRDGRRIGRLDPIFKGAGGIAEAQVVQEDYDRFCIRVVPGKDYREEDGRRVAHELAQRVGEGDIRVEVVSSIERTAAGKVRAILCNLPAGA